MRACHTTCDCPCHLGNPRIMCECYAQSPSEARTAPRGTVVTPTVAPSREKPQGGVMGEQRRDGRPLTEQARENYLSAQARKRGCITFKIAPLEKGLPDRAVLVPFGRTYFVEMKMPGGRISPAQAVKHDRSRQIGHPVHVLITKQQIDDFLRWALKTGVGLRDARKQHERDLEMIANNYGRDDSDCTAQDLKELV